MLIVDMTVAPADITYPTDMELLNMSREKTEEMIDVLYGQVKEALQEKPRTHRRNARKAYLIFAKKRKRSYKFIRKSIRKQLGYVGRNIRTIHQLLDRTPGGLDYRQMRTFWIIQELYRQQKEMYNSKTNRIDDRIVSVNQPQVRPIVRQKKSAPVEFGAQVSTSIMNGLKRIESIKWDACNEADDLPGQIEHYKETYGYYPDIVLADKKYGTKKNRVLMKELGIRYGGTPLGRPKKDQSEFLPKEVVNQRNAIEGNYGTGKRSYGLDCIKARRADTSESWIGAIFFVMNLPLIVKLLGSSILSCSKSGFSRLLELFFIPRWSVITEP
jgi:hypothetical protein